MRTRLGYSSCLLLVLAAGLPGCEQLWQTRLREAIEGRFSQTTLSPVLSEASADETLHAPIGLSGFYGERGFRPVWITERGLTPQARELVRLFVQADEEGLRPADYHGPALQNLAGGLFDEGRGELTAAKAADTELLLTDAFMTYANHAFNGRIDPRSIDSECVIEPEPIDAEALLRLAVENDNAADTLRGLLPDEPAYRALRDELARYREIAENGDWNALPLDAPLAEGDDDPLVPVLRERLGSEGFHSEAVGESESEARYFDESLAEALRRFQRLRGLPVNGAFTPQTAETLNVPAAARAEQIALNLERWRWLPQRLGARHVLINIAGFFLEARAPNAAPLRMRVIVGKDYRRTPVLSSGIDTIILNPYWGVPPTIAKEDVLPQVKKNRGYLERERIRVFDGKGVEVDAESIDWNRITAERLPYVFRQDPGPGNPLGRIKFLFPNPFNVYLHDTPAGGLFRYDVRTFSSGCIRVERPLTLALFLLGDEEGWTHEKLIQQIERGRDEDKEIGIRPKEPTPVHLVYWTAWVDEVGEMNFREDIYSRDEALRRAFQEPVPCAY